MTILKGGRRAGLTPQLNNVSSNWLNGGLLISAYDFQSEGQCDCIVSTDGELSGL